MSRPAADPAANRAAMVREAITLAGIDIELFEGGDGAPLLFLHGAQGFSPEQPYVGLLTQRRRLIAPSHPGFGASALPLWLDSIDDIAYLYLEFLDRRAIARPRRCSPGNRGCTIQSSATACIASRRRPCSFAA